MGGEVPKWHCPGHINSKACVLPAEWYGTLMGPSLNTTKTTDIASIVHGTVLWLKGDETHYSE